MHVSNNVRPRETSDPATNPASYAWLSGASSFISILHEVGEPHARGDDPSPKRSGNVADAGTPAKPEDTAATAPAESVKPTTANGDGAVVESSEAPPETGGTPAPSPATESPASVETDAADVLAAEDATGAPQELDTEIAIAVTGTAVGTPTPTTTPGVDAGNAATRLALGAAAESPARPVADSPVPRVSTGVVHDIDVDIAPNADGAAEPIPSGQAPFPRTLNALLAEGALRGNGAASATPPAAELDVQPERPSADALQPKAPVDVPDAPAPLPQAPALEGGGVRLELPAAPRIPLATLPGELAQQIHMLQQEGAKTMRIRLVPENLGELHIEISGRGNTLRVHMTSPNAAVRDALDSQMNDLKQALHRQGMSLDNVTVGGGSGQRDAPLGHGRPPAGLTRPPHPEGNPVAVNATAASGSLETRPGTLNILA